MKIEKLHAGDIVFDVGRQKMGNTTMSTVAVWGVRIIEVDIEKRTVVASWNGNTPRKFYEGDVRKWRAARPTLIKSGFGYRLAKRGEVVAPERKKEQ